MHEKFGYNQQKNNWDTPLKVICDVSLTSKGQGSYSSFEKVLNNKCFISEIFFRFGQILFSLAYIFTAHQPKSFVAGLFKVSIDHIYLLTLSLEKETIVL